MSPSLTPGTDRAHDAVARNSRPVKATLAVMLALFSASTFADNSVITFTHLRGNVYVVRDEYPISDENSAVYIGVSAPS
jgi:hypothetical protein